MSADFDHVSRAWGTRHSGLLEAGRVFSPGGSEFLAQQFAGQAPGRHARPARSLLEPDGDVAVNRDLIVPVSELAHYLDGPELAGVMGGVVFVPELRGLLIAGEFVGNGIDLLFFARGSISAQRPSSHAPRSATPRRLACE